MEKYILVYEIYIPDKETTILTRYSEKSAMDNDINDLLSKYEAEEIDIHLAGELKTEYEIIPLKYESIEIKL